METINLYVVLGAPSQGSLAMVHNEEVGLDAYERLRAGYDPSALDMLCLTGEVGWARLSSGPAQVVGATPVAIFVRDHADVWHVASGFGRTIVIDLDGRETQQSAAP